VRASGELGLRAAVPGPVVVVAQVAVVVAVVTVAVLAVAIAVVAVARALALVIVGRGVVVVGSMGTPRRVPVVPVLAPLPPAVVVVAAGAFGAGRPTAWLVAGIRRAGLVGLGGNGHPDPRVMVRPWPGPALPGPGGPRSPRPRALGRLQVRRSRRGRGPVEDGASDRSRLLPRRAPLHHHDHPATAGLRRRPAGRPVARRRAAVGGTGPAARPPDPPWFRRLDLDDLGGAQVGDRRVEPARHRAAERLHQQLAGRHHRRQRRARQRRHAEGDDQRGAAA
jgi:hypothetical protein